MGNDNKKLKVIIFTILLILVLGVMLYFIVNMQIQKKVTTNTSKNGTTEITEDSSLIENAIDEVYVSLTDLPEDYTINDAITDYCFIGLNTRTYNRSLVDDFIKSINENVPDKLRIVYSTLEKDIIIKDISYDGTRFVISIDMTRDKYISEDNRSIFMKEYSASEFELVNTIEQEEGEEYRTVYLKSTGPIEETIRLFRYNITSDNIETNEVQTFYGKIIKSSKTTIQVKPNDEYLENLADKIEIQLEEGNKTVYELGTDVKIKYRGYVYDTDPATIDVVSIQFTKDTFVLSFENTNSLSPETVARKDDIEYQYDVYQFGGKTYISIGEEEKMELGEALKQKKITIDKILESIKDESNLGIIEYKELADGGSYMYKYEDVTILVLDDLNGNQGIYFGNGNLEKNTIVK